nr:MAG TPA: hypothetical protein [Caudoviricetes sp.]
MNPKTPKTHKISALKKFYPKRVSIRYSFFIIFAVVHIVCARETAQP